MLIKVNTDIFIDVKDEQNAEQASLNIESGLASQMGTFPSGEVLGTRVNNWSEATPEEAGRATAPTWSDTTR